MITRSHRYALTLLLPICAVMLLVPGTASAAFTRPFLPQITGSSGGSFAFKGGSNFDSRVASGGIAIDQGDNLWVSDGWEPTQLDEFSPAYAASDPNSSFAPLPIDAFTTPQSLAIDDAGEDIYVTGRTNESQGKGGPSGGYIGVFEKTGGLRERWKDLFEDPRVAVDNSTESVYVAHGNDQAPPYGDGAPTGVEKFNAKGDPVDFADKGPCIKDNEIIGYPNPSGTTCINFGITKEYYYAVRGLTVDAQGDIFILDSLLGEEYTVGTGAGSPGVVEYSPSGSFIRVFTGGETPGLLENHEGGGWGGELEGIAFDPVSGHLLVSVSQLTSNGKGSIHYTSGAIDEFEAASGQYVSQITEATPGMPLGSAFDLAVDSKGDLYAVDEVQEVIDVYGPGAYFPSLKLAEATERTPESAVLNGSVNPLARSNPEYDGLSACYFQYVTEAVFKHNVQAHGGEESEGFSELGPGGGRAECVPPASSILANEEFQKVHADIHGLEKGVTYRYRLVASTAGKHGGVEESSALAFTAPAAPEIVSTAAGNLSSKFAALSAGVDPHGASTAYYFQYVDEADFDATGYAQAKSTPIAGAGSGGSTGSSVENVLQHVGPLAPGTTYDFRVVAENAYGVAEGAVCEGELRSGCTFTTLPEPAPGLPDDRAYELVTPPNKLGGRDMFASKLANNEYSNDDDGYPSESGDGFLLETQAAFGPFPSAGSSAYVFQRDPEKGEWTYTSLASPSLGVQTVDNTVFDPADLSQVAITDGVGAEVSEAGTQITSLIGPPGGPYTTLNADPIIHGSASEKETTVVGASWDPDHVILESGFKNLCANLENGAERLQHGDVLCEWAGGYESIGETVRPALELVNVNNAGTLLSSCGAALGAGEHGERAHDAVSPDGSKAFFTAPDPSFKGAGPGCWEEHAGKQLNTPQLYMRSGGETIELSAPEAGVKDPTCTTEPACHPAEYVGASEDGSEVFFVTETELTKEAVELGLHDNELYEYNTESDALTRISAGEAGEHGVLGADIRSVPAISADGTEVYFTAFGALTANAPQLTAPETRAEGSVNLYRYDIASATTTYVSTISTYDYELCGAFGESTGASRACAAADWYTTPDGGDLLFDSSRGLTGYSTAAATETTCVLNGTEGAHNGHCEELYRYEASSDKLTCVSCNPSGAAPVSNARFARSYPNGPDNGPVRGMSDNGAYVFFDSADALVPEAENHTLDVYEWEAQGMGGCGLVDGCVHLISSGTDPSPSFFLGASPDGGNVFFGTSARLVPQDTDSQGDVYDARICTAGEPCFAPPPGETAQCLGGTCQTPPSAPANPAVSLLAPLSAGATSALLAPKPKAKPLTKAQKLAAALKVCKKQKKKAKRVGCETQARKKYSAKTKSRKSSAKSTKRSH